MKSLTKTLSTLVLLFIILSAQAQKKPTYKTEEAAVEAAYNVLDSEMQDGKLIKWAKEGGIKGNYTMDITMKGKKGEVVTVKTISRENGEIKDQNRLKNYIKNFRFPFKMPKDKSYQFQYQFKF